MDGANVTEGFINSYEIDLLRLAELDGRLHVAGARVRIIPNMSGNPLETTVEQETAECITEGELGYLIGLIDREFMIYPENANMGFGVGFVIAERLTGGRMLKFSESQLPPGVDFDMLREYFMQKHNVHAAKKFGVHISPERSTYDY